MWLDGKVTYGLEITEQSYASNRIETWIQYDFAISLTIVAAAHLKPQPAPESKLLKIFKLFQGPVLSLIQISSIDLQQRPSAQIIRTNNL